jgi:outer membrane protein OmpA-like peptidoglycan-associated protein
MRSLRPLKSSPLLRILPVLRNIQGEILTFVSKLIFGRRKKNMQKKNWVIILLVAVWAMMITGCGSSKWLKNTGTYPTKTVVRAGGLPDLVIDPRISDTPVTKAQSAQTKKVPEPGKTNASAPTKTKTSSAVKAAEENLSLLMTIDFDFAKYFIRKEYNDDIKKVADTMKENLKAQAVIKGYTDSIGKRAYNMRLSKKRANSLKQYLVKKFGIKASRIATIGYGFDKPVASNDTEEGRQKNRRAEIFIKNINN